MRFLLLLSALFAAITGVAGARADARPVAASAVVATATVAAPTASRARAPLVGVVWRRRPSRQPALAVIDARWAADRFSAERRRE